MSHATVNRRIVWQRLDVPGHEWAEFVELDSGTRLAGVAVGALDGAPYRVEYEITLDDGGASRAVRVGSWSPVERDLRLTADGQGRWYLDGSPAPVVHTVGEPPALDVDLGFSPVTNTLPIRRLAADLSPGERREIRVAWVLFPSLEVVEARQTYTRLGDSRWRYASTGFEAELEVDEDGLVERYENLWTAIARA